ncbi:hypothetical protein T265_00227 [Opisthorchis viverrini]|uniref:Reverse transcriptase domain-containing protein n=1 Tax=Opisthorchis viverrini TaxID=6198 RepID=A0A075AJV5_OPIVI|nr:hypothetical protein T265_00227 [Opisthorchis viverrini]KER34044.1 hypothetical protein T265_00227 [Opisthorchis viverrini]
MDGGVATFTGMEMLIAWRKHYCSQSPVAAINMGKPKRPLGCPQRPRHARVSVDNAMKYQVIDTALQFPKSPERRLVIIMGCLPHLFRARVTPFPKVPHLTSPDQLRPISVSSILVRCFHKVLADRSSRRLQLFSLQFAFMHRDGCLEATSLLHALLRHSSATASNLSLAFVDKSKVFDSVSHDTIVRSAEAFGALSPLVRYIA